MKIRIEAVEVHDDLL